MPLGITVRRGSGTTVAPPESNTHIGLVGTIANETANSVSTTGPTVYNTVQAAQTAIGAAATGQIPEALADLAARDVTEQVVLVEAADTTPANIVTALGHLEAERETLKNGVIFYAGPVEADADSAPGSPSQAVLNKLESVAENINHAVAVATAPLYGTNRTARITALKTWMEATANRGNRVIMLPDRRAVHFTTPRADFGTLNAWYAGSIASWDHHEGSKAYRMIGREVTGLPALYLSDHLGFSYDAAYTTNFSILYDDNGVMFHNNIMYGQHFKVDENSNLVSRYIHAVRFADQVEFEIRHLAFPFIGALAINATADDIVVLVNRRLDTLARATRGWIASATASVIAPTSSNSLDFDVTVQVAEPAETLNFTVRVEATG